MKNLKFLALLCWAVFFFAGCNKDNAKPDCGCDNPIKTVSEIKVQLRTDGNVYDDWYFHDHKYGGITFYKICNIEAFKSILLQEQIQPQDGLELLCKVEFKEPCSYTQPLDRAYHSCNVLTVSSNK